MPHGRSRRRKTMEPKAIANMNGTLVTSPKGAPASAPSTPLGRRASSVWMRTPSDKGDDEDGSVLTPVPFTPATEAIARFVQNITDTPSEGEGDEEGDESVISEDGRKLVMMTCPPKKSELKERIFGATRDKSVMERLMAARRKSLQFAPKVGSPLAKAWQG
ncbi:hypothetical protein IMZ48_27935 [Candidatus Bathyarchaeota archaeon]|nr:hypothetical protein [Candidatus Bathyarchaeota archaeon]